jgi:hypothetical protein
VARRGGRDPWNTPPQPRSTAAHRRGVLGTGRGPSRRQPARSDRGTRAPPQNRRPGTSPGLRQVAPPTRRP